MVFLRYDIVNFMVLFVGMNLWGREFNGFLFDGIGLLWRVLSARSIVRISSRFDWTRLLWFWLFGFFFNSVFRFVVEFMFGISWLVFVGFGKYCCDVEDGSWLWLVCVGVLGVGACFVGLIIFGLGCVKYSFYFLFKNLFFVFLGIFERNVCIEVEYMFSVVLFLFEIKMFFDCRSWLINCFGCIKIFGRCLSFFDCGGILNVWCFVVVVMVFGCICWGGFMKTVLSVAMLFFCMLNVFVMFVCIFIIGKELLFKKVFKLILKLFLFIKLKLLILMDLLFGKFGKSFASFENMSIFVVNKVFDEFVDFDSLVVSGVWLSVVLIVFGFWGLMNFVLGDNLCNLFSIRFVRFNIIVVCWWIFVDGGLYVNVLWYIVLMLM